MEACSKQLTGSICPMTLRKFVMPSALLLLLVVALGIAAMASPFGESYKSAQAVLSLPKTATDKAIQWLNDTQNPDGSFGTGQYLPKVVETSYIVGLVAASNPESSNVNSLLDKAVLYIMSQQKEGGDFEIEGCLDSRIPTVLGITALNTYRNRKNGQLQADSFSIEAFDIRSLRQFFKGQVQKETTFDNFIDGFIATHNPVNDEAQPCSTSAESNGKKSSAKSGMDLFYAALAACACGNKDVAVHLRGQILRSQNKNGSWGTSTAEASEHGGSMIINTATMLRALRLLNDYLGQ